MVHRVALRARFLEKGVVWLFFAPICIVVYFYQFYQGFQLLYPAKHSANMSTIKFAPSLTTKAPNVLRLILLWTNDDPLQIFKMKGQTIFLENRCTYHNCYTVYKHKHEDDLKAYDAIIFSVDSFSAYKKKYDLPTKRKPDQRYIFASTKSATSADPITDTKFDNFFNWTWTYRLDSDILWRHFTIHDLDGREIGPKIETEWLEHFDPISEEIKTKLRYKKKAAAWLVYTCQSPPERRMELYVFDLQKELDKYNLTADVYGPCRKDCGTLKECAKVIERDYYFYLAFEDSFDTDYVSYGLLNAVNNYAVPVVMGGANYSRFLPPGSFLDATKMNATEMSATMFNIMTNLTLYREYFRWKNHYEYRRSTNTEVCNLCSALNDHKMTQIKINEGFTKWWWTGTNARKNLYDLINKIYVNNLMSVEKNYNKLVQESLYMY